MAMHVLQATHSPDPFKVSECCNHVNHMRDGVRSQLISPEAAVIEQGITLRPNFLVSLSSYCLYIYSLSMPLNFA